MKRLILLATGGTIASRGGPRSRSVAVDAAGLLKAAREVGGFEDVEVEAQDVSGLVSFAATVPDVLALARTVGEAAARADGVVVTHGTDALEESALLLALTHTGTVPVAVTGAQRPYDDAATDGPRNLSAALRWAASPEAAGTGVTVVFGDEVLPAVGVRKTHTLAVNAFSAPGRGTVGRVDEAGVRRHGFAPRTPLLVPGATDLPRVDVVAQYLGADASALEAAVAAGARGIVLAAFGSGNTTPPVTAACLRLLAEGLPVLVTSRTGEGPVVGMYEGGGGDLAEAGAVFAGDLSPWQARMVLAAALAAEEGPEQAALRARVWLQEAGAIAADAPPTRADHLRPHTDHAVKGK